MNPDAAALALATIEVDISAIEPGQSVTVKWRGKPVFVRHRTDGGDRGGARGAARRAAAISWRATPISPTDAPATDANRAAAGPGRWLIMVGVCTHLGCVPLGQQGDYGGWFCPCHGSVYDTAGRIRQGPAPENLPCRRSTS